MSKVKHHVKVTIEVLGKELTQAEAETLYLELGVALSKPHTPYQHPIYIQPPWQRQNFWYGTTTSGNIDCSDNITACGTPYSSDSVYEITNGTARGN